MKYLMAFFVGFCFSFIVGYYRSPLLLGYDIKALVDQAVLNGLAGGNVKGHIKKELTRLRDGRTIYIISNYLRRK